MGSYQNFYNWVADHCLGGSRTAAHVEFFVRHEVLGRGTQFARFTEQLRTHSV